MGFRVYLHKLHASRSASGPQRDVLLLTSWHDELLQGRKRAVDQRDREGTHCCIAERVCGARNSQAREHAKSSFASISPWWIRVARLGRQGGKERSQASVREGVV